VSLDDWSRAEDAGDSARTKRLAGSYIAALVLVAGVVGVGIVFGGQIKKQVLEEEVTVKLVPPEPVKAAPPPPPPPPPPPKPAIHYPSPGPNGAAHDAPPTELPKGPPDEGDPNKPKEEVADGDPNGVVGGTGRGGGIPAPKPVEAPPPPPPPPAPIVQVAEAATPPIARSKTMPAYPEDARKQGIEALVIVKFIVTEDGHVDDVRIVKGHPLFDDAVLTSVRQWSFEPATLDGHPVRMARMVKIPFRLKHS
jgi:protein TonB